MRRFNQIYFRELIIVRIASSGSLADVVGVEAVVVEDVLAEEPQPADLTFKPQLV